MAKYMIFFVVTLDYLANNKALRRAKTLHSKILTVARRNQLEEAETELQSKIDALGEGWEIVSASTVASPFKGGQSSAESGPYHGNHHIMYVVSAAFKKLK